MTQQPCNPQTLTPEDIQTLKTIQVQLALSRLAVLGIVAYGAYDYWQSPNPLGPILFGIAAFIAHSMRPEMPQELRKKLQPPG